MSFCSDAKGVIVRKPHRCEWCQTRINAGEQATTWSYVDGGQMFRSWMHPECEKAIGRDKDGWEAFAEYGTTGRRGMSYDETDQADTLERIEEERESIGELIASGLVSATIDNNGTIEDLHRKVREVCG